MDNPTTTTTTNQGLGDLNREVFEDIQNRIKQGDYKRASTGGGGRVKRQAYNNNTQQQKPVKFSVDLLPIELRRTPLFNFCKLVCGKVGKLDLNDMFDLAVLEKQTDGVTVDSLHHTVSSAIVSCQNIMNNMLEMAGLQPISFFQDILPDYTHPLYVEFYELVACSLRQSLGLDTKRPESGASRDRNNFNFMYVQRRFAEVIKANKQKLLERSNYY